MTTYKKYGLLGRTLGHSLSPQIHELIFKYTEIEGEYALYPMEPEKVKDFVLGLGSNGLAGINVTIPYKRDVIPFLSSVSAEAEKIDSVNTIMPQELGLKGYNTDYFGVEKMLEFADIEVEGKKVMVLGSGGSARTVVAFLKDKSCDDIMVVSRDKKAAAEKFVGIKTTDYESLNNNHGYEVLINTTPVGMYPNTEGYAVNAKIIEGFSSVADLIYNPAETKLLQMAKENGAKYTNGLYMLVSQAVKAQEIWNGIEIADEIIDKIYEDIKKELQNGK